MFERLGTQTFSADGSAVFDKWRLAILPKLDAELLPEFNADH